MPKLKDTFNVAKDFVTGNIQKGHKTATDYVMGHGSGSSYLKKADDYITGQAMGDVRSGVENSYWEKLSGDMGKISSGTVDDIYASGVSSGVAGAGMGAVAGMFSEDQSVLGGAMMGFAGGAGVGGLAKARQAGKGGKISTRMEASGRRLRDIRGKMTKVQPADAPYNPAANVKSNVAAGMPALKRQEAKYMNLQSNDAKALSGLRNADINPYVTGGVAAMGSLAYATLHSNRI